MALTKITSNVVKDDAVTSAKIVDGGIATADIAANAVTSAKIAQNSILTKHIDDGQVTTDQLGADAVTSAKIADDAISEEHLDVTVITSLSEVTAATGDLLMIADISDSNNLKKIPVSSIQAGRLALTGGTITGTVVFNSAPTFNTAITMGSSLNVATTVGIAGTTVIDGSRNLTNIGTISSGAISTSSSVAVTGAAGAAISEGLLVDWSTNLARFLTYDSSTGSEIAFYTQPSGGSTTQALRIDSSQNSTFAGTISSGAITTTGITSTGTITLPGSTAGVRTIKDSYGSGALANQGFLRSSGGNYWAYSAYQDGSANWKSAVSIASERSVYAIDEDTAYWSHAPSQTVSIGSDLTTQPTKKIIFDLENSKVGINTSTPTAYANSQATLVIQDTGSPAIAWSDTGQARDWFAVAQGSGLHFIYADGGGSGGASNVTSSIVLDNSGKVGIGTDGPTTGLHVVTGGGTTPFRVQGGANSGVNIMEVGYAGGGAGANFIVDDNGSVGINETNPLAKLHVKEGDSGQGTINSNFDQLCLEDDLHSGMTILSGNSSDGAIYFGDSGSNDIGQIKYKHNGDVMAFTTSGEEKLTLYQTQNGGITEGYLKLASIDSATLIINADTDNSEEDGVPTLDFKMDGSMTRLKVGVDASNNPYISTQSDIVLPLQIKTGTSGNNRVYINDTGMQISDGTAGAPDHMLQLVHEGTPVDDRTFISIVNGSGTGDISTPESHIDFEFFDSNTNQFPQARITAGTGTSPGVDANTQNLEGEGYIALATSPGSGTSGEVDPTNRLVVDSQGRVLIGTTSSNLTYGKLQVAAGGETAGHGGIIGFFDTDASVGSSNLIQVLSFSGDTDATGGQFIRFRDSNSVMGSISAANGTQVSYGVSSDERLKKNIVDASSQLNTIKNIKVREFDWKVNDYHEVGMIAQELHTIVPSVVQEGGDDVNEQAWSVDYGKLTPYLIKAMQEQQTIIDDLTARIEALEDK